MQNWSRRTNSSEAQLQLLTKIKGIWASVDSQVFGIAYGQPISQRPTDKIEPKIHRNTNFKIVTPEIVQDERSLERKLKNFQILFEECGKKEEEIVPWICPMCVDFLIQPVSTQCGHVLCLNCWDEETLKNPSCPLCGSFAENSHEMHVPELQTSIISQICGGEGQFSKSAYLQKLKAKQQFRLARSLPKKQINIGDKVDIRTSEGIWAKGSVQSIFANKSSIFVEAKYQDPIFYQTQQLPLHSLNLAKPGYFTNRVTIPFYSMKSFETTSAEDEEDNNSEMNIDIDSETGSQFDDEEDDLRTPTIGLKDI